MRSARKKILPGLEAKLVGRDGNPVAGS